MSEVAVVILNWNGRELLEKFLPSVVQFSSFPGIELIVADNASSDDSVSYVQSAFPSIRIIRLDKNYGFAEGYNRALSEVTAKYFVLLNSDVEVTENWLGPLILTMNSNRTIAACQPRLLSYTQRNCFEYAGASGGFIDRYGYTFCRGRLFNIYEEDCGQYSDTREIFWATGACMMINAHLYKKTGGLDAAFFAHMEEIDLCWRLKNRGFKIMVVPESIVYHLGGGTLNKMNPWKTYLNFRNNLYLLYKNMSPVGMYWILFVRMILDGIAGLKFLAGLEFDNFLAVVKAHFSFYGNVNKFRAKRRINLKRNRKYNHPEMYNKSIVFDFFFRRIKKFSDIRF